LPNPGTLLVYFGCKPFAIRINREAVLGEKWVKFRVRDVFIPDPVEIIMGLFGNDILEGRVVDEFETKEEGRFVAVKVRRLEHLLIIPCTKILDRI
jgi:hypothetical protein